MADAELSSILVKGLNDPEALDQDQKIRFVIMGQCYINHFMTVLKHHEAGHLPEEEWLYHSMGIAHMMNSPGGKYICEVAAITPSVLRIFEEHKDKIQKDGFLWISNPGERAT